MRLFLALLLPFFACGQTMPTQGYGNSRTNGDTQETRLTQSLMSGYTPFKLLGQYAVDGSVQAQPLIIDGVNIMGATRVLIVVTEWSSVTSLGGSVYAFNADLPGSAPLWKITVVTGSNITPYSSGGCPSTPVVDTGADVVYVVCRNNDGSLTSSVFALNLADGSTYHASTALTCTNQGITYLSTVQGTRAGLLLYGGSLYVASSIMGAGGETTNGGTGWVFKINPTTLAISSCLTVGPNIVSGIGGPGVWEEGTGIAVDSGGNLRFATGNGGFDGSANWGESILKTDTSFNVLDSYTPSNWSTLNSGDLDQGGCLMVIGTHIVTWGKSGLIFVDPTGGVGGTGATCSTGSSGGSCAQSWDTASGGTSVIGSMSFGDNVMFLNGGSGGGSGTLGPLKAYAWNGATFNTTPVITSGTWPRVSVRTIYTSNSGAAGSGILWALTSAASLTSLGSNQATLRAFNPSTMAEIWNSDTYTDTFGFGVRFAWPTVADGMMYAPGVNAVYVYGVARTAPAVSSTSSGVAW